MKKHLLLFLAVMMFFVAPAITVAQSSQGILTGVVRDSSGAVVPNVTVTIKGVSDGFTRTVKTKADGVYRIESLSPELYTLTAMAPGFGDYTAKGVNVTASQVTSFDAVVKVGAATDTVSVLADSQTVNTDNGSLASVITSADLAKLPIFSLSPYELVAGVPGAQNVSGSGFSNGQNVEVNGARPRANNFLLDSQEINDVSIGGQAFQPAIPDSYESVTVLTSAASAEYGRAGGAVVNLVTKQGTNAYHGTAYERYTGSGLNALGGQERGPNAPPKGRYDTHTYGFTAGGPIIRNKLFAFGGLALERFYGKETPAVLQLPDAAGYATLQAIAAAAPGSTTPVVATQVALINQYLSNGNYLTTYNPVARPNVTCSNGSTAPACVNVGQQPGCQTATVAGCTITEAFFQRPTVNANNPDTQWTYRIDYKPWDKDQFYFRYLHDRTSLNPDFGNNGTALVGFDTLQGGPSELGVGGWTHVFTPNLLNEFRAAETRLNFQFGPTPATSANPLFALYTIGVAGLPSLGPNQNFPQGRGEDLYQFQDTVGWTKGRQSLRIGVDIGRQLEKDLVSQNAKGTLSFAKGGVSANGINYQTALGNFLQNQLGPSGTATRTFGPTRIDPHDWRTGVFIEDDIKVNADLSINLGLRYDYLSNPENSLKYPGLDPNNPFGILTSTAGVVTATQYKIKNDANNFGPRFGFAYSPHNGGLFGDGKSVIRGGVGVFYDSDFSNFVVNAAQSSPNAPTGTITQTTGAGVTNATSQINNITPTLKINSSVTSVVNNMVNPLTYQYNLGIEHQFPGNIFVAVRYVGSRGEKLFANQQYNYFSGITGARLNPTYGAIVARGNFADSNYNSLLIEANHGFRHGFQIRSSYQFSKNLDDGSEIFTTLSSPTSYTANLAPGGRRQDYGPSAYDHRHYFALNYVWSPAGFHSTNSLVNGALGALTRNWTVAGISFFQSGNYSSFSTSGLDINGDGSTANDRPIIGSYAAPVTTAGIDGSFVGGTPGVYYDLNAVNATGALNPVNTNSVRFLVPSSLQNQFLTKEIGRGSYLNPGNMSNNVSLEKGFGLSYVHLERGKLILRAEAQNIANHNNIGPTLDTNVLDIGTGNYLNRANAKDDGGRSLVLWAKFQF